jgi:cyclopropane fatty-acyl-phospholipid synthase-like methyltransferase
MSEAREYWEENIEAFSRFYDAQSEERILGPSLVSIPYRLFLFPVEKRYMRERFLRVSEFIERAVRPGMRVVDAGCGDGVYLPALLQRGASVCALDFTRSATELVRRRLAGLRLPEGRVEVRQADITESPIPECDVALAIGVMMYVDRAERFFDHILPRTRRFLFNYIDGAHPLNRLRRRVPALNVRRLVFHTAEEVEGHVARHGFRVARVTPLATGRIVEVERVD